MTTTATTATTAARTNPLQEGLRRTGQSAWLDYIRRDLITSGELKRLIEEDGLGGVTSNPAIFEKAITGSTDYTDALLELQKRKDLDADGAVRKARDQRHPGRGRHAAPVYDRTKTARRLCQPGSFAVPGHATPTEPSKMRGGCGKRSTAPT